jgi:hypothetical protein
MKALSVASWFETRYALLTMRVILSPLSFRDDAKHRTRNLEISGLVLRTIPE